MKQRLVAFWAVWALVFGFASCALKPNLIVVPDISASVYQSKDTFFFNKDFSLKWKSEHPLTDCECRYTVNGEAERRIAPGDPQTVSFSKEGKYRVVVTVMEMKTRSVGNFSVTLVLDKTPPVIERLGFQTVDIPFSSIKADYADPVQTEHKVSDALSGVNPASARSYWKDPESLPTENNGEPVTVQRIFEIADFAGNVSRLEYGVTTQKNALLVTVPTSGSVYGTPFAVAYEFRGTQPADDSLTVTVTAPSNGADFLTYDTASKTLTPKPVAGENRQEVTVEFASAENPALKTTVSFWIDNYFHGKKKTLVKTVSFANQMPEGWAAADGMDCEQKHFSADGMSFPGNHGKFCLETAVSDIGEFDTVALKVKVKVTHSGTLAYRPNWYLVNMEHEQNPAVLVFEYRQAHGGISVSAPAWNNGFSAAVSEDKTHINANLANWQTLSWSQLGDNEFIAGVQKEDDPVAYFAITGVGNDTNRFTLYNGGTGRFRLGFEKDTEDSGVTVVCQSLSFYRFVDEP